MESQWLYPLSNPINPQGLRILDNTMVFYLQVFYQPSVSDTVNVWL